MEASIEIKLDSSVLARARRYAKSQKQSLSEMISSYLSSLGDSTSSGTSKKLEVSPFVRSMEIGEHLSPDLDIKALMRERAEEKHK